MNKTHRVVWNAVTGMWAVAPETAKSSGKKPGSKSVIASTLLTLSGTVTMLPTVASAITVGAPGLQMCVNGATLTGAINSTSCEPTPNSTNVNGFGLFTMYGKGFTSAEPAYITGSQDGVIDIWGSKSINILNNLTMSGMQVKSMAAGTADTDAVNFLQLKNSATSAANAIGGGSTLNTDGTISAPSFALTKANAIAGTTGAATDVGSGFTKVDAALGALDTRVSQNTTNIAGNTTAITDLTNNVNNGTVGLVQQASAGQDLTVGNATDGVNVDFADKNGATRTLKSVTAGALTATSTDAVNGSQLYATNVNVAQNTSDITNLNTQINNGSVGLVQQDATTRNITIAKGTDGTTVDFTGTQGARVLDGVANGAVNASSKQAVNGSQLFGVSSSTAAAFGGGSTVNSDGTITAPSYTVGGTTVNNVGDAITNLDGRTTQNSTDIANLNTQISSGSVGLVQQDATTHNITVAKNADGTTVDFTGTQGARVLDGVANGAVNASSKQAVNGSQLFGVSSSTAAAIGGGSTVNSDGTITAPSYTVGGTTVNNVGDAITNLDGRTTQNTTDITNLNDQINNGEIGLVQQDAVTRNINVAANTDGTTVNFAGMAGARVLDGVAAGAVNAQSKQAVNGSQLNALASSTASSLGGGSTVNGDGSITAPSYTVDGKTVNNAGDAFTNLDTRVTQNTADISTLNTNVSQNTSDIANLTNNVTKNTTDIAQNTADISNITNQINSGTVGLVQQDQSSRTITVAKNTDGTVVDMTGTQGARTVTGVAAGTLSADSTDAVNGAQLYQTNLNVSDLSQRVDNVANSTSIIASQTTGTPAIASGTNSTAMGNGANASGNNSVAIGSGSVANEDNTVSVGSAGNERRITNVAPGVNGTDAANMNQLNSLQGNVDAVARQAFSGIAAAMAMPNLTPSQPGKTVVAAGVANYKGYTAMGVGGTYRSRDSRWLVNMAASITPRGDTGVRGQVGYEF